MILVTHQIQFIKKAAKILVLKEGEPLAFGSYEELMNRGIDFMSLIKEENPENADITDTEVNEQNRSFMEQQIRNRTISVLSTKSEVFLQIYL